MANKERPPIINRIDPTMIGRKFGRLTVLELDHHGRNGPYYLCECDCGSRTIVSNNNLKTGNTTSCGCKRRLDDILDKRFGRLLVIEFDHMERKGASYYRCKCDCGNEVIVSRTHLLDGHTSSCGCWNVDYHTTHGMTDTSLYHIWINMRQRCNNPDSYSYHYYGGRGIWVCDDWDNFETFRDWANATGYEPGLSIDRIDNDDGYYPDNCRWATALMQANNRRTCHHIEYHDERRTIADWARLFNVAYSTLYHRVRNNDMQDFESYFNNGNKEMSL